MNNNQEANQNYKCPTCGNTDTHSVGYLNGKPYCRRCISFKGEEVEYKQTYPKRPLSTCHTIYHLSRKNYQIN